MSKNNIINVALFGEEVGRLGFDPDKDSSYFQYNPDYLDSGKYSRAFPYIFKRIRPVQVFNTYRGETFRGLPPMIADSLPDMFGNTIFKEWIVSQNKDLKSITPLEQLAYVANRGMGALEYFPAKDIPQTGSIQIDEIVRVLEQVLHKKSRTSGQVLNTEALFNIFKIGTSAGGARPKILISENKLNGQIVPGDIVTGSDYNHYLVKLNIPDDEFSYYREQIEFAYYQLAIKAGIQMMPSTLIDGKHFATLRYDRQDGEKLHTLTASGLTGWDFKQPQHANYENLFKLALDLQVPYKDISELFRRMVFNIVFANADDHLKNHSFIYDKTQNNWALAPAYDLTFPFNTDLNFTHVNRALSVNNKRIKITREDVLKIAETYSVKNPVGIINDVLATTEEWESAAQALKLPQKLITTIRKSLEVI